MGAAGGAVAMATTTLVLLVVVVVVVVVVVEVWRLDLRDWSATAVDCRHCSLYCTRTGCWGSQAADTQPTAAVAVESAQREKAQGSIP